MKPVAGHCPACGSEHLVLTPEGELVCVNTSCTMPTAAHLILAQRPVLFHIVRVIGNDDGSRSFTVKHPLIERINGLLGCDVHDVIKDQIGLKTELGTYWTRRTAEGTWELSYRGTPPVEVRQK